MKTFRRIYEDIYWKFYSIYLPTIHLLRHLRFFEFIRVLRLRHNSKLVHGAAKVHFQKNELMVLCTVRNGQKFIRSFIEHYSELGAKHIIFLDTGSDDNTVKIAREFENVTVLSTTIKYKHNEFAMKRYLFDRFSKNRWSIFADIDEFFDYPYSDKITITDLLEYLNKQNYNAVVTQMLDMFSITSDFNSENDNEENPKEKYEFYDLSGIRKFNLDDYSYADWLLRCIPFKSNYTNMFNNNIFNADIKFHMDGIRKSIFNTNNYITKFSLVFTDGKLDPVFLANAHLVANARIADFSTVLYHYKLTDFFYRQVIEANRSKNYNCNDYEQYYQVIKDNVGPLINMKNAKSDASLDQLLENNFLVVSGKFENAFIR